MNMKKHFETATEPFEFTTLTKYGRKVVLEFNQILKMISQRVM